MKPWKPSGIKKQRRQKKYAIPALPPGASPWLSAFPSPLPPVICPLSAPPSAPSVLKQNVSRVAVRLAPGGFKQLAVAERCTLRKKKHAIPVLPSGVIPCLSASQNPPAMGALSARQVASTETALLPALKQSAYRVAVRLVLRGIQDQEDAPAKVIRQKLTQYY
ncbi:MAG TPA: hypothetical protein DHI91_00820 [Candidatus Portnoybacteria bacterium]|nr:hypothetical protein [Candidatus Portnoybacteria bacterium]